MALTDKIVQRVTLEDGTWIDVRKPGVLIHSEAAKAGNDAWLVYLHKCIVGWGYEEALTEEAIGNLDQADVSLIMDAITPKEEDAPKNPTRRSISR